MSMRPCKSALTAFCGETDGSTGNSQPCRWRIAYTAICFTKVLLQFSKKVIGNKKRLTHSLSYVALDVIEETMHEDRAPFESIDRKALNELVKEKSLESLNQLGGINQVAVILESHVKDGISGKVAALEHRRELFGANENQKPPAKSFLSFVLEALKDKTIIILLVCAIFSLGFGIKQHGFKQGWYDGGSIIVAILLLVGVSAVGNYKQSRQFQKLSSESSDIKVQVVRDGRQVAISIFDVVVGDVVSLRIGDQVPADGLFLEGYSLKIDESSVTGESDHIEVNCSRNPFLLSGTKVTDGFGCMLVTSVGMNTAWGQMMSCISHDLDEQTPLQMRLYKLTSSIGKIGLAVAVLVLGVLMIRYFTGTTRDESGHKVYNGRSTSIGNMLDSVVGIIAAAVTIVVVAIPEGLPLAVTLTLAYSMRQMMNDNAMVRKLSACETMGSATTICTDKTGTLTLNEMKVVEFWLGKEAVDDVISLEVAAEVFELLQQGVSLNTTGSVNQQNSNLDISGSPTEKALLSWAVLDLGVNVNVVKKTCEIVHVEAFNSEKKRSGLMLRKHDGSVYAHWKGAAEMVLAMCSHYYLKTGEIKHMDIDQRAQFEAIIQRMASKSLRCIAFALKKDPEWGNQVHEMLEETDLTLLALVGLKDPLRPGVRAAVESCKNAGVSIKMITGDNVHTAKAIAIECGILNPDDENMVSKAVVEGVKFRNYSPEERMARIDEISVMARSSPFDKLLMVQCLKQKGHVVAVTGDGTNDAPALKEAHIGLSMGIQGTEVAKECSGVVILDDNFSSVVTILRWGRCVYNNIQQFVQFQLTVNVAALVINFVAAVSSGKVPLTAVQMLWVNLIMDTLGALALATEQPTNDLMTKRPVGKSEALITRTMWRNIIAQALYQVAILLTLQFKGKSIFGVNDKVKDTLVFNTFVLCQVFNEFNARQLERTNIFSGIHRNKLFMAIIGITIVLQVVMVEVLKKFAGTERLNVTQWGICIAIAAISWPIGWLVKCVPLSFKASN